MRPVYQCVSAAAAVFLAACAPMLTVGSDVVSDLQPSAYSTYAWAMPDQFPTGDPRLDNNPFFVTEVQRQIDSQLGRLGLRQTTSGSDLTVHFHATVRDRVNVFEVDRAAGYNQARYERPEVVTYEEGTILVDIAEAKGKKVIWRGWIQTDLGGAIGNHAELARRVRDGMERLFYRFPAECVAEPR